MLKSIFNVLQTNCLTYCLYLLLASTIVTKSINCFVLENTEWSTVISDINTHGTSDNSTTTTTIDDSTDDASTDLLRKLAEDINEAENGHSAPANDVASIDDIETGRKKYGLGKKKKYRKFLAPVLIGLFITKMIMFPLFVKMVTFLSSSAFVFSKMSLLVSLILGLKFFLSNQHNQGESKVEIVHVPLKKYGGDWDRETAESKFHVNTIPDTMYEHDFRPTQYVL